MQRANAHPYSAAALRLFALPLVLSLIAFSASATRLPDFTKLVEDVAPAVVNISTTQAREDSENSLPLPESIPDDLRRRFQDTPLEDLFEHFFDQQPEGPGVPQDRYESESLGSGFIISADGYVLTNEHVVRGAEEIIVKLHDRRQLKAELIGVDKRSDVAVLKIKGGDNLPHVELAKTNPLKVGEWVIAIGSPFGFDYTVTAGIVSAIGRNLRSEQYVPFIQTDVAINPGNSGGPLFNQDGAVVGINSQIFSRSGGYMGMSFAIPIKLALQVTDQLREDGHVRRGWLGVLIQEVDRDLAKAFGLDRPKGALVAQVMPDSPAERSGLKVEDIILDFNGRPVNDSSSLPPLVGATVPGETVPVTVWRDGKPQLVQVKIEELDETTATANKPKEARPLGMRLIALDDEKREALKISEDGGVIVLNVAEGPARDAGLRIGDVVLRLNGTTIESVDDFSTKVEAQEPGTVIRVLVHRDGNQQFVAISIPATAEN